MTLPPDKLKMRDVAPTGVRLAPELKSRLSREAAINGRTLHAEILFRLQQSLDGAQALPSAQEKRELTGGDVADRARGVSAEAPRPPDYMAETDRAMLGIFRRLPPDKQLALLSLFR